MQLLKTLQNPFNISESKINIEVIKININDLHKIQLEEDNKPGVYCFYDDKNIYIGESARPFKRLREHYLHTKLKKNHEVMVFRSDKFNKSAVYNIETKLIDNVFSEGKYNLINNKTSQSIHEYYLREYYEATIKIIWKFFLENGMSNYTIPEIEQLEIFKFSPFKSLNIGQESVLDEVMKDKTTQMFLIEGWPGTGKSVVASTMFNEINKKSKIALVAGTEPIFRSFKKVFKKLKPKNNSIIAKAKDIIKSDDIYDLIIVDEAHRLLRKGGKGHPNKFAHLNHGQNDLDELKKKCKQIVVLYDYNQKVSDGDIDFNMQKHIITKQFSLKQQMRASEGYDFINFIIQFLHSDFKIYNKNEKYDIKVFEHFSEMYKQLQIKNKKYDLVRLLSGYTREWISKQDKTVFDFDIDGVKLHWNSDAINWIDSDNAKELKEVAYYHTIQGFDLNYAGVIIGKDIYLDENNQIAINEKYVVATNDRPNKSALSAAEYELKLKEFVLNRYKVLLTRGAKGCYIYAEDKRLAKKLKELIK